MFARLGCLFVLVPLVELAVLIQVGRWIGVVPTIAIVAVTGVVGAWLARREGVRTLVTVQNEMAAGRLPGGAMMDGAAIVVGGALLLTPGVLSDLVGFALLIPPTRSVLKRWARRRLEAGIRSGRTRVTFIHGHPHPPGEAGPPMDEDDPDGDRPPRPGEIVQ
ncbi:MAG: FxsA family protein [Gemmatimonadales bacterium]|nr:MAG: FxsA family protein [Gemmatimonadales bacterium]